MAVKALHGELSEAALNAPDLDEGQLDVEHYPLPSGDDIADPYLREVWAEAKRLIDAGESLDADATAPPPKRTQESTRRTKAESKPATPIQESVADLVANYKRRFLDLLAKRGAK